MIKSILKGLVIGLANVIPGVSGGTMMVSMGIYDKLIHSITHLFSEFKKSFKFLLPIFLGIGAAIVIVPFGIEYLFGKFPLQTNFAFIGLILGGLPSVWGKVKGKSVKAGHIIAGVLFFALVVGLAAMGDTEGKAADLTLNPISIFKLFGVGVVASATMVIPGVSGSMMLLLMGYYHPILETITNFITAFFAFDTDGILLGIGILAPFGIGVVLGIFGIAKVIEIIFEKFPLHAYWAIIGLIISSPIAIILVSELGTVTVISSITSIITFGIGFIIATKLGE